MNHVPLADFKGAVHICPISLLQLPTNLLRAGRVFTF